MVNLIEKYKSMLIRKFFQKSNWMIAVSYLMKRKIKKIFLELISDTKIFNIKFLLMKLSTTKILPNLQVDWTTSNTVYHFIDSFLLNKLSKSDILTNSQGQDKEKG